MRTGIHPWFVAVNPVTNKVNVTNFNSSGVRSVRVIDGRNNTTGTVTTVMVPVIRR